MYGEALYEDGREDVVDEDSTISSNFSDEGQDVLRTADASSILENDQQVIANSSISEEDRGLVGGVSVGGVSVGGGGVGGVIGEGGSSRVAGGAAGAGAAAVAAVAGVGGTVGENTMNLEVMHIFCFCPQ